MSEFFNLLTPIVIIDLIFPSSCQNDSGGPVFFTDNRNVVYSLGVVNYGVGCASSYPSVNVRVTSYLKWIQSKTPSVNYCAM